MPEILGSTDTDVTADEFLVQLIFTPIRAVTRDRTLTPYRSQVRDSINHEPCEIAYYDRHGVMIGYWAYGSYDPDLPYQG